MVKEYKEVNFEQFMIDFQKPGTTITVDKKELQDTLIDLYKSKSRIKNLERASQKLARTVQSLQAEKVLASIKSPYTEYLNLKI